MASRYLAGIPRVRSVMALARSRSGNFAPHVGVFLELLHVDLALGHTVRQTEVAGRIRGLIAVRRPLGLAARRAGAAIAVAGTAGLVLQFLDLLIELDENFALHGSRLGAAARQVEAVLDDAHLASDPVEILVLPGRHVVVHQHADHAVTHGCIGHVQQQAIDGVVGLIAASSRRARRRRDGRNRTRDRQRPRP